jgi:hypothetical protein
VLGFRICWGPHCVGSNVCRSLKIYRMTLLKYGSTAIVVTSSCGKVRTFCLKLKKSNTVSYLFRIVCFARKHAAFKKPASKHTCANTSLSSPSTAITTSPFLEHHPPHQTVRFPDFTHGILASPAPRASPARHRTSENVRGRRPRA